EAAGGDLVTLPTIVGAVAVVAEHAAHGATLDVAVHPGLPGIDLAGEQRRGRLDDRLGPSRHLLGSGLDPCVAPRPHELQEPSEAFDAVLSRAGNIAARRMRTEHHQQIGKTFRLPAEVGARSIGPNILEPDTARTANVDAVERAGDAVEAGGIDQDVEFVLPVAGFDTGRGDAIDWRLVQVDQQYIVAVVGFEITAFEWHAPGSKTMVLRDQLVGDLRVLHPLADLLGDEFGDCGVGLLVDKDVAEIAHPDAEARLGIQLFPECFTFFRRHVGRLARIRAVDEPTRAFPATRIDFVVAGLDLRHLLLADLAVVQRRGPIWPTLEDGEVLCLLCDLRDRLDRGRASADDADPLAVE